MLTRLAILFLVLGGEAVLASYFLDGAVLDRQRGLAVRLLHDYGAWAVRFAIGFAALFATFAFLRHRAALTVLAGEASETRSSAPFGIAHLAGIAGFAWLSSRLYVPGGASSNALVLAWTLAAAAALVSALLAAFPVPIWLRLRWLTGHLWAYAGFASLAACVLGPTSRHLWEPATRVTFSLVRLMIVPLVHDLTLQPEQMRLGTPRFSAIITPECSGLEGVGLLLAFGVIWLVLFRRECRFPQALLLLPLGLITLFLLNSVRIAALILIGDAGARDVAARGFHSQAGWISFNLVAFAFSLASRRLAWFSLRPAAGPDDGRAENPTAAYLMPFLAILAAGMLSRAVSGGFEWFYSLRLFAALAAFWFYRRAYAGIWRSPGWLPIAAGVTMVVVWILADRFLPAVSRAMPAPLAAAPVVLQATWIVLRVLAAVVTVPLAEELAFRGYLLRRLVSADFESLSPRAFTWFSFAVSSIVFGLLHGSRWVEGTIAGALYALLYRRGGLSAAFAAHASTNLALGAYVLLYARWDLW